MPYKDKEFYYIYRTVYDNQNEEELKGYRHEYYELHKQAILERQKERYSKISSVRKEFKRLAKIDYQSL